MLTSNIKIKNVNIPAFEMVTKIQIVLSKTKLTCLPLLHLKLNVILQFTDERQFQKKVKFSILNLSQLHPDSQVPTLPARGSHIKHPTAPHKQTVTHRRTKGAQNSSRIPKGISQPCFP